MPPRDELPERSVDDSGLPRKKRLRPQAIISSAVSSGIERHRAASTGIERHRAGRAAMARTDVERTTVEGRALAIGAGVSGLTTALCLRRAGFDVSVVAEKFAPDIVSVVAGALWEWPPAVCGHRLDPTSLERSKGWCMDSYRAFWDLARQADAGVFLRQVVFYFRSPVAERPRDLAKMNELSGKVRGFVHSPDLIRRHGISPEAGVVDAYGHLAPMIDTDAYMAWLMRQVRTAGCRVERGRIGGSLRQNERALKHLFGADVIVNCTGLGAMELASDEMYPLRGALVRVHNDGRSMPRITTAHCVAHEPESSEQDMIFIVPRGRDMLLLGGMTEAHEWGLDIGLHNYGPVRDMLARCQTFLPVLAGAQLDEREPVRVGLRPFRTGNVRVEPEPGTSIIHNYGHGGSGVTFSWGCAHEVVDLARHQISGDAAPPGRANAA
jgi:D-amino-acid oxidase